MFQVAPPTGHYPIMSVAPEVTEPALQTCAWPHLKKSGDAMNGAHVTAFVSVFRPQSSSSDVRMPPTGSQTMTVRGIYSDIHKLHNDVSVKILISS